MRPAHLSPHRGQPTRPFWIYRDQVEEEARRVRRRTYGALLLLFLLLAGLIALVRYL